MPKTRHAIIFCMGLLSGLLLYHPIEQAIHLSAYQIEAPGAFNEVENLPIVAQVIHRPNYVLAYDGRTRNPYYVHETITKESLQGHEERTHHQFKEDHNIPKHIRASLADFRGSGYDRGHLSPCSHHRASYEDMADSFYLSNVVPQDPQCNRGFWAKLERHVRDLTNQYDSVKVTTGPLFLPEQREDGKRYVVYEVIGENNVAMPSHLFKLIRLESERGVEEKAYLVPNQPISADTPLESFETTVENVERVSGILFNH